MGAGAEEPSLWEERGWRKGLGRKGCRSKGVDMLGVKALTRHGQKYTGREGTQ